MRSKATNVLITHGKNLVSIAILISTLYILIYYHKDGNLRDAGVYFDSGIAVLKGNNPYVASRWGSFGPVPFSILLLAIPEEMRSLVVQILSLAGIYAFFRIFFPNKRLIEPLAISFVILWTSPVRELLVTNQMTGIAIGLLALGVKFLNSFDSFRYMTKEALLGALLFTMALDLKPHICIFFFLSWVIYKKSIQKFFLVTLSIFTTHLVINISQRRILEIDWLNALSDVNKSATAATLGDSLSFWPIINYFTDSKLNLYFVSVLITFVLSLVCFFWAYKGKWDGVLFLSFFIPSTSIYYHYYDAIPLCVLFVVMIFQIESSFLNSFAVPFILIPKEFMSIRNQLLVVMIVGLLILRSRVINKNKKKFAIAYNTLAGFISLTLLHMINRKLELSEHLLQSLIVTESLVIIVGTYFYSKVRSITIGR